MTIADNHGETNSGKSLTLAAPSMGLHEKGVLLRAKTLQAELEQFASHLASVYEGYFQEFPKQMHVSFYHDVLSEIETLERDMNSQDPLSAHRISSSNLPYLHAVWDAAKRSRNIVKLRHPVFSGPFKRRIPAPGIRIQDIMSQGGSEPKKNQNGRSTRIDIICDGGLSWYKVSTITNRRLLFDMAKEAVYCGDSDDSDGDNDSKPTNGVTQYLEDIPLVKLATTLKRIAQGHQIRNASPVPGLILPRIFEGEHAEIDGIVKSCRDMGLKIVCGGSIPPTLPLSEDLLREMVPYPKRNITQELNIDTSVLVALASDISHFQVAKQDWFGQSQKDHIDLELISPLIPQLCATLDHHKLVCTREAATSLARIVHTMGTATENIRAHLLFAPDDSMTQEKRVEEFHIVSIHRDSITARLQLPIRIVDFKSDRNTDGYHDHLNATMLGNLDILTQPGRAVFSFGWAMKLTTITCNVCM